ncbi:hypothetical protein EDB89DRAFT_1911495 [Lactarius sanguifluus]|nr:hypothetical protein EDB89DRAFT_1911495 [Lactarius sanguifluus]
MALLLFPFPPLRLPLPPPCTMPSFMRRFKQSQNLDIKDTPTLMHSPSTISSTSQSSISISLRRRMTTFTSLLHFPRGRGRPSKAISHISNVPWPRSPSRSPSPPSSDIRPPSVSGNVLALSPSWTWPAPIRLSHLPSRACPRCSQAFQRTLSHPARGPPSRRTPPAPAHSAHPHSCTPQPSPLTHFHHQRIIVTSPQVFEPRTPRLARQQARQSPPIPLSFVLAHVPRSRLPVLARVSKRFSPAAQLALYDADACVARLAGTPHLAALHGPSFVLALALALRSMRALSALTLPAFDAELLSAAPDTLPYVFFDGFLAAPARARPTHLALPHFVGVPPAAQDVPSTAVPRLAVLDSSPGLAAALAPGRPLCRVTLHIASTLYDGLRPAALFGALGGSLKELVLVLAPTWTCIRVSLQVLYKQVGSLLPNIQAGASNAPPAGYAGDRGCHVGGRGALGTRARGVVYNTTRNQQLINSSKLSRIARFAPLLRRAALLAKYSTV